MSITKNGIESHIGQVVETGRFEYQMSDYSEFGRYAIVLKADGTYEHINGYDLQATVDATPEQVQAHRDHQVAVAAAAVAKVQADAAALEARTPRQGKKVRVVRGRKVPKGTEGVIFWTQEQVFSPRFQNGYRHGPDSVKIGIALDDTRNARGWYANVVWTYMANVEVVA